MTKRFLRSAAAIILFVALTGTAEAKSPAVCGPDDRPETGLQGQVPIAEQDAGFKGFWCNLRLVGQNSIRNRGGNHQLAAWGDCAYYGTILALGAVPAYPDSGVAVLDVADPKNPELLEILRTPGAVDVWEALHAQNGVLAMSSETSLDIYDISDCRKPRLMSTTTLPAPTHGFRLSDDGRTVYAMTLGTSPRITVIDISDPTAPKELLRYDAHGGHDMDLRPDGNRAYVAMTYPDDGVAVLDTSDIQARKPNPQIRESSVLLTSDDRDSQASHTAKWVQRDGRQYLLWQHEFFDASCEDRPQAFVIDITDERMPVLLPEVRLEVNDPEICEANNVTADDLTYNSHYVGVDNKFETKLVFWNWFASGTRVFDFTDPRNVREVAYYNPPVKLDTVQRLSPVGRGQARGSEYDRVDLTTPYMWYQPTTGDLWTGSTQNGFQVLEFTAHGLEQITRAPSPTPAPGKSRIRGGITLDVRALGRQASRRRYRAGGRLLLPDGLTSLSACRGGSVQVVLRDGRRTVGRARTKVRRDCSFKTTLRTKRVRRGRRLAATASFRGNDALLPVVVRRQTR